MKRGLTSLIIKEEQNENEVPHFTYQPGKRFKCETV